MIDLNAYVKDVYMIDLVDMGNIYIFKSCQLMSSL